MKDKTEEKIFISGTIERVTYHNQDNGFCVLQVKARVSWFSYRCWKRIYIIRRRIYRSGWIMEEWCAIRFAVSCFLDKNISAYKYRGDSKILGTSNLIKGIGEVYATKMVSAFGADVFEIIEKDPNRPKSTESEKWNEKIIRGWETQKDKRYHAFSVQQ